MADAFSISFAASIRDCKQGMDNQEDDKVLP